MFDFKAMEIQGSYGYVVISDDKSCAIKTIEIDQYGTLNEIVFMNTFCRQNNEFFPLLDKIEFDYKQDIVQLHMNYCGFTLREHIMYFEDKLDMLPDITNQMANALQFLREHNIIHMDIKPENICILQISTIKSNRMLSLNTTNIYKMTLIDFGFAIPYNNKITNHIGTYVYADPRYNWPCIHCPSSDVYSFGFTMLTWLIRPNNFLDEFSTMLTNFHNSKNSCVNYPSYRELLNKFEISKLWHTSQYIKLYAKMINYNHEFRPTPIDGDFKFIDLELSEIISNDIDYYGFIDTNFAKFEHVFKSNEKLNPEVDTIMCECGSLDDELKWHFATEALYGIQCHSDYHLINLKKFYKNKNNGSNLLWKDIMY